MSDTPDEGTLYVSVLCGCGWEYCGPELERYLKHVKVCKLAQTQVTVRIWMVYTGKQENADDRERTVSDTEDQ